MKLEEQLKQRSNNSCELTGLTEELSVFEVQPNATNDPNRCIYIAEVCKAQLEKRADFDPQFWEKYLPTSMWSEVPAVQVVAYRLLQRMNNEAWAADALDMLYLDEDTLEWAKAVKDDAAELHKDVNGNILVAGDTVTLIKDLDVKGSSLNAKIGTAVRNIRLVHDNHEQIEGKVDGQTIVILTKFVKKQ